MEQTGEVSYFDEKNKISAKIKLGSLTDKEYPTDFFTGTITKNNEKVSEIFGSYLSFIDFDNKRYWDIRENYPISIIDLKNTLPSSSFKREDLNFLKQSNLEEAQKWKDILENTQRNDRKLREKNTN